MYYISAVISVSQDDSGLESSKLWDLFFKPLTYISVSVCTCPCVNPETLEHSD